MGTCPQPTEPLLSGAAGVVVNGVDAALTVERSTAEAWHPHHTRVSVHRPRPPACLACSSGMRMRDADPRDIAAVAEPDAYRVTFWRRLEGGGWWARDVDVSEATSVVDVIEWASHTPSGQQQHFTVSAIVTESTRLLSVRLYGRDPTEI